MSSNAVDSLGEIFAGFSLAFRWRQVYVVSWFNFFFFLFPFSNFSSPSCQDFFPIVQRNGERNLAKNNDFGRGETKRIYQKVLGLILRQINEKETDVSSLIL